MLNYTKEFCTFAENFSTQHRKDTNYISVYTTKNQKTMTQLFIAAVFGMIGFKEIFFIALIVLLFFGGKKIPELMRGIGKGVKSFKDGMNEIDGIDPTKDINSKDIAESENK